MITRLSDSLLLHPRDIKPSQSEWEVIGVFNPAVAMVDDGMVMLARVAERPIEQRSGWAALPRWTISGQPAVDWFRDDEIQEADARVVALKDSGNLRLTSVSHIQIYRQSRSGGQAWEFVDVLLPEGDREEYGIEDPRIIKIDETYWITYVVVSQSGAATSLMSTTDFMNFQRHDIIFASENKDVVLFPQRIGDDYLALHRPNPNSHFGPPRIWLARSPDLIHWGRHEMIFKGEQSWEGDRVGSGTPPVLIDEGWLSIYHGSERSSVTGKVGCYAAGALLLDRDNPSQAIARSSEPIMVPTLDYETKGFVPNVIFPTAMLHHGDEWQVFYGAADTSVAVSRFSKQSVMDSLVSM